MMRILNEEQEKLQVSFNLYLQRIRKSMNTDHSITSKLENAHSVFSKAKVIASGIDELIEPLQNIKQVNKMVRFALQNFQGQAFVNIAAYIGAIANICLGQLKYVRGRYETILRTIKEEITHLWMDRELAESLRLILSVNHLQFKKFLNSFQRAEVLYADVSLAINRGNGEEFQQRVVLRMVSNRLPSREERKIISTLFPDWDQTTN